MVAMVRPLLAAVADVDKLTYPLRASPKLDGIRVIVNNGVVYSRSGKPIPNKKVQKLFGHLHGADGELIVGSPTEPNVFQTTTSIVMSIDKEYDVTLYLFDAWNATGGIMERYASLSPYAFSPNIKVVEQRLINDKEELLAYETECLGLRYEGVILRAPKASYKHGRSTAKEGTLLKLKRFEDSEAVVIAVGELMLNVKPSTINSLGYKEKDHKQESMVSGDMLGSLTVRDIRSGVFFNIGSGFTQEQRIALWKNADKLIGKIVRYQHFPAGVKDKPRFPTFLGFRSHIDMEES